MYHFEKEMVSSHHDQHVRPLERVTGACVAGGTSWSRWREN
jgi:hypothetical protein